MIFYILIPIFIIVLDQITKYIAVSCLKGSSPFSVIDGVFRFTYHENKGAAWGILSDHRWVFMLISTVAIICLIVFLYKIKNDKSVLLKVSVSMFIGGGIGNMIDRVFKGYVVDFIDFCLIDFPIFNVADSFVTIAAFFIIIYLIKSSLDEKKEKNNADK